MAIERKNLGLLTVNAGDVVCFSMDAVMRMKAAMESGVCECFFGVEDVIETFGGVCCEMGGDGIYGVDKVTILDTKGQEYNGALIGGPDGKVGIKQIKIKSKKKQTTSTK